MVRMRRLGILALFFCSIVVAAAPDRPRVAIFPIAGDAPEQLRERTAFSLRSKLDRAGAFDVVDGPKMQDVLTETNSAVALTTDRAKIIELAKLVDAQIAVWGELAGEQLKVKLLDLRSPDSQVQEMSKTVKEPTDLRFAVEEVLERIKGVGQFEHPVEQSVWDDETSRKLWQDGPNLLANGDFSEPGKWTGIYQAELYPVAIAGQMPPQDKVAIVKNAGGDQNNALAFNLSRYCAENNGLACLSDAIPIEPATRYRLSYRYKSDAPVLHVFVKGYTKYRGPTGEMMDREIYRRQVPVSGKTNGQWVTVVDDFNPQHIALPVQNIRVDLYAYLHPGTVLFDDVIVKAVGKQTREGKDAAIKPAATRPRSAGAP